MFGKTSKSLSTSKKQIQTHETDSRYWESILGRLEAEWELFRRLGRATTLAFSESLALDEYDRNLRRTGASVPIWFLNARNILKDVSEWVGFDHKTRGSSKKTKHEASRVLPEIRNQFERSGRLARKKQKRFLIGIGKSISEIEGLIRNQRGTKGRFDDLKRKFNEMNKQFRQS